MKSHELFRDLLRKKNAKEMAADMGLSPSLIYKWAEPAGDQKSGAPNPLERVRQLHCLTRDHRIADWVCAEAGGFFVQNVVTPKGGQARSLAAASSAVVQEFAGMLSAIAKAAIEETIEEDEAVAIRSRWQKLQSITEQFVQCCETRNFANIHKHARQHVAGEKKSPDGREV
ncbi:MAG TPA: phage regulatory CII family protein [Chthoniobacteraceae bacterium]|jgi:hypothetical protein|nr:phage regulatory CII family protein [Chthoniobacteraceae bacterium]